MVEGEEEEEEEEETEKIYRLRRLDIVDCSKEFSVSEPGVVGGDQKRLEASLHPSHVSFDFCTQSCFPTEPDDDSEEQLGGGGGGSAPTDGNTMENTNRPVFGAAPGAAEDGSNLTCWGRCGDSPQ